MHKQFCVVSNRKSAAKKKKKKKKQENKAKSVCPKQKNKSWKITEKPVF